MQKFLTAIVLVLSSLYGFCQSSYSTGLLPQVNLNLPLHNGWRLNTKLESRQVLAEGLFREKKVFRYRYERTDLAMIVTTRTGINSSAGAGYMLRVEGNEMIHRFIQQFSVVTRYRAIRLGHRIAADQTIQPEEPAIFRFRYRISSEIPLNGLSADPKEFYFKPGNEYLFAFQKDDNEMEIRATAALGYGINAKNKVESGIDYRVSNIIRNKDPEHQLWFTLSWFIKIK